jgi:class 3 adenylate cyclase
MKDKIDAVIVFVDARGFTRWAEKAEAFAIIEVFGAKLQSLLSNTWNGWFVKHLGDGLSRV